MYWSGVHCARIKVYIARVIMVNIVHVLRHALYTIPNRRGDSRRAVFEAPSKVLFNTLATELPEVKMFTLF